MRISPLRIKSFWPIHLRNLIFNFNFSQKRQFSVEKEHYNPCNIFECILKTCLFTCFMWTMIFLDWKMCQKYNVFAWNQFFSSKFATKLHKNLGNPFTKNKISSKVESRQVKRSSKHSKIERLWLIGFYRRILTWIRRLETKGKYTCNIYIEIQFLKKTYAAP